MRGWTALAAMLPALVLAGGCSGPGKPSWASLDPDKWSHRRSADEPIILDVEGPVAVDVDSFNGDVIVTADPKLTEARITIVREGVHGKGRAKEAVASLDSITYTTELAPGDMAPLLRVRTSSDDPEPHFQRAHVYINLPEIRGLTVRTSNGRVNARNIGGDVNVRTTGGDVRIMTPQPMTGSVTIVNRGGDIDYRVRGESTGSLDCQTVNGHIINHVKYGTFLVHPQTTSDSLRATLNDGTNPVVMRTVNGDIRIAVVHDPEHVGLWIFD